MGKFLWQRNFPISFKPKVAIDEFFWKIQRKTWYSILGLDAIAFSLNNLLFSISHLIFRVYTLFHTFLSPVPKCEASNRPLKNKDAPEAHRFLLNCPKLQRMNTKENWQQEEICYRNQNKKSRDYFFLSNRTYEMYVFKTFL